jgi:hypothetical protein
MANKARVFLMALFGCAALSCYSPDLMTQIYKCDRGKCPEDFFCNDNKYCTQAVPSCAIGGIQLEETIAVCVGASNAADPLTICANGATTAKCDMMMVQKPLCTGMGLELTYCNYCCK